MKINNIVELTEKDIIEVFQETSNLSIPKGNKINLSTVMRSFGDDRFGTEYRKIDAFKFKFSQNDKFNSQLEVTISINDFIDMFKIFMKDEDSNITINNYICVTTKNYDRFDRYEGESFKHLKIEFVK